MKRNFRKLLAVLSVVGAAACAPPAAPPGPPTGDDATKINALRDGFMAGFNAGDAAKVAEGYTSDGVDMPAHHAMVVGKEAIAAYNREVFSQISAKLTITPVETVISGNWGYDRGTFTMMVTPKAGGPSMTDQGKYIVLLQKQSDGAWKVTRSMDSSDLPMPTPPPPPPAPEAKPKGKGK